MLNPVQLLCDLQDINAIGQSISGCLDPEKISHRVTQALVERFDCAFARIWLTDADQQALSLVASSGLYTHTNGSFARVPMGAYKVGKIAQNRVPFLSNCLVNETWVKDRDWAIKNRILGFAGYPLMVEDRVLGVLATFSHQAMAPEFLEVLQVLCLTTTIALDAALQAQSSVPPTAPPTGPVVLSDQLTRILMSTRLMLVGTERELTTSATYAILRAAEVLMQLDCSYCRLTYGEETVSIDAIAIIPPSSKADSLEPMSSPFAELQLMTLWLGGTLHAQPDPQNRVFELLLQLPYASATTDLSVLVQCQQPVLQVAFTHLCLKAGLGVCDSLHRKPQQQIPYDVVLTDYPDLQTSGIPLIWIQHAHRRQIPGSAKAVVTLDTTPDHLQAVVIQVVQGTSVESLPQSSPPLSEREQEIIKLLSQGLRDRDIARQLYISPSTVRFHLNNTLIKLKAKNRYQGVFEATRQDWI